MANSTRSPEQVIAFCVALREGSSLPGRLGFWIPAGVRPFGRLFRVRFSCESRDIPKCLSALAGFSHHSDSGQRTLEEIGHVV